MLFLYLQQPYPGTKQRGREDIDLWSEREFNLCGDEHYNQHAWNGTRRIAW